MALTLDGDNGISGINGSATTPAVQGTDTNTGLTFGTDTVGVVTGGTTRTTVDGNGRLLVGTTTAVGSSNAVVIKGTSGTSNGSLYLGNASNASTLVAGNTLGFIEYGAADGGTGAQVLGVADGTWSSTSDCPTRLVFSTTADGASSPTERGRFNANGGFRAKSTTASYVNTSAGHHEMVVTGNNNILNLYHTDSTGGNCGGLYLKFTNAAPNGTGLAFRFDDSSAMRFLVRTNGGIANYQSNDSNLCDEREKKNIVDLDSTWDCLKQWELKKFHYNEDADTDNKRYGVIAQQVAQHCPEVIADWVKQDAAEAVLDDDGNVVTPAQQEIVRMGVKEQQMMWMAIKALQEAQTRIEQLETRVAQLEGGAA
jgi:hypothetical protein